MHRCRALAFNKFLQTDKCYGNASARGPRPFAGRRRGAAVHRAAAAAAVARRAAALAGAAGEDLDARDAHAQTTSRTRTSAASRPSPSTALRSSTAPCAPSSTTTRATTLSLRSTWSSEILADLIPLEGRSPTRGRLRGLRLARLRAGYGGLLLRGRRVSLAPLHARLRRRARGPRRRRIVRRRCETGERRASGRRECLAR